MQQHLTLAGCHCLSFGSICLHATVGVNDPNVCMPLYVLWILQQTHLVAMCPCHWPLCSPSGRFTHSASRDRCSIRGPSRTTDTQTKHDALIHLQWVLMHKHTEEDMKMISASWSTQPDLVHVKFRKGCKEKNKKEACMETVALVSER